MVSVSETELPVVEYSFVHTSNTQVFRLIGAAIFQNPRLFSKPFYIILSFSLCFYASVSVCFYFFCFSCVIRGCVPKKILVYGSAFRGEFEVPFASIAGTC